jgi:signal transduction histidine kinase
MARDGWVHLLDLVLGAEPDGVYVTGPDGRFTYASRRGAIAAGATQVLLLGKTWRNVGLPPSVAEALESARAAVQASTGEANDPSSHAVVDGEGGIRYALSKFTDVGLGIDGVICRAAQGDGHALLAKAAVYGIAKAVHTTPDLRALCRQIYRALNTLMPAQSFAIALLDPEDDERFSYVYAADRDTDSEPWAVRWPRSRLAHVARTRTPMRLTVATTERMVESGAIELYGLPPSAWVGAPLIVGDRVIGAIGARHDDADDPYVDGDVDLMAFIAREVAVGIERKRAGDELAALTRTLEERVVARTAELDRVIRGARCSLYRRLARPRDGTLRWEPGAPDGPGFRPLLPLEVNPTESYQEAWERSIPDDDARRRQDVAREAVLSDDDGYEVEYRVVDSRDGVHWMREAVSIERLSEATWEAIGVITDVTEQRAAEDALRASEQQRTLLVQRILSVQEEERARIAWELHDQVGQELSAILIGLRVIEAAPSLGDATTQAHDLRSRTASTLEDIRKIAVDMRPGSLDDLGLEVALAREIQTIAESAGLVATFDVHNAHAIRMDSDIELSVYRVASAAAMNAAAHAQASTLAVAMQIEPARARILLEDDGIGFDVGAVMSGPPAGRFGLLAMTERLKMIGGRMSIESTPGEGSAVLIEVELPPDSEKPTPA